MNIKLLRLKPVAIAPRYARRKRARFFARAFCSREVFAAVFMCGVMVGIGLSRAV